MALALQEGPHHGPRKTAMTAVAAADGYVLQGHKCLVLDGHVADKFVVVARTAGEPGDEGGLSLFLVDADTAGIAAEP